MTVGSHSWLLPEYLEDVLPPRAYAVERIRRRLLDIFHVHGYSLVLPPMLEYLESLLTGTGSDLDLRTFKLVDQLGGRMLGVRADITPQAARIDAHLLNRRGVTRLCYAGSVLHTLPSDFRATREPLQIGAELFGHAGIESDIEIQRLLITALEALGLSQLHLDLGHVGIFRGLMEHVPRDHEGQLFEALQRKDVEAINHFVQDFPDSVAAAFRALPELYGDTAILLEARGRLPQTPLIRQALDALDTLDRALQSDAVEVRFDLAESRGYHYHSGTVFSAYAQGRSQAIAQGGRYDDVGQVFGRARPATGFSLDVLALPEAAYAMQPSAAVLAPCLEDAALHQTVATLRARGEIVINELPGHDELREELGADRALEQIDGGWRIVRINE